MRLFYSILLPVFMIVMVYLFVFSFTGFKPPKQTLNDVNLGYLEYGKGISIPEIPNVVFIDKVKVKKVFIKTKPIKKVNSSKKIMKKFKVVCVNETEPKIRDCWPMEKINGKWTRY